MTQAYPARTLIRIIQHYNFCKSSIPYHLWILKTLWYMYKIADRSTLISAIPWWLYVSHCWPTDFDLNKPTVDIIMYYKYHQNKKKLLYHFQNTFYVHVLQSIYFSSHTWSQKSVALIIKLEIIYITKPIVPIYIFTNISSNGYNSLLYCVGS